MAAPVSLRLAAITPSILITCHFRVAISSNAPTSLIFPISFTVITIIIVRLLIESRVYTYYANKRYGDRVMQRNPNLNEN
jgi:hypothetical protein